MTNVKKAIKHLEWLKRQSTPTAAGDLQDVINTLLGDAPVEKEDEDTGWDGALRLPGSGDDLKFVGSIPPPPATGEMVKRVIAVEQRQNRLDQEMGVKRRVMEGFNRKLSDVFKMVYDVKDLVGSLKHKDPGTLFGWLGQVSDQGRAHEDAIRQHESDLDELKNQAAADRREQQRIADDLRRVIAAIDLKLGWESGPPPPSWALPEEVQVLLHRMNGEIESLLKGEAFEQYVPPEVRSDLDRLFSNAEKDRARIDANEKHWEACANRLDERDGKIPKAGWRHPGDGTPPPYVTAPKDADEPFLKPEHVHWKKFKDEPGPGVQGQPHPETKPTDLPSIDEMLTKTKLAYQRAAGTETVARTGSETVHEQAAVNETLKQHGQRAVDEVRNG